MYHATHRMQHSQAANVNGFLRHSKCYIAPLILLDVVANRQSRAMTQEEVTRLKLKTLVIQPEWQADKSVQLDRFEALCTNGKPVPRPDDPNAVIICPHWKLYADWFQVRHGILPRLFKEVGPPEGFQVRHGILPQLYNEFGPAEGSLERAAIAEERVAATPSKVHYTLLNPDWFQVRHGILPQLFKQVGPPEGFQVRH